MTPNRPSPVHRRVLAWAITLSAGLAGPAVAQVRYFDTPPTPEVLRQMLIPPAGAAGTAPVPTAREARGIEWTAPAAGGAPAAAAESPSRAEPASAAAPAAQAPVAGAAGAAGSTPSAAPTPPAAPAPASAPAAAFPIQFDLGSARVTPASIGFIEAIATLMAREPALRLEIEGHTDVTGPYTRNMMLSWERAYSVFKLLVERYGIDPKRLQPIGRGPLEPMPGMAPSDARNRRVQFRLAG